MSCGEEGGTYRYRVTFERNGLVTEGRVFVYFGDVADNVTALLEHLAKPGDNIVISVFAEED